MKKSFMTRALAMGLSLAMAFSLSAATNVSVASAAATPAMASKQFAVRVGGAAKSYKASAATQKSFKITKATVGNTDKATVKVNSSKKSIKVTPGTVTGTTVVKVTFKNIKTAKTTAKKYRCVVKAAIEDKEPEKPVEEVKATKITEAKAATAKTINVTFDGVVDTSTATAIKVERGTTPITVTAKYADDKKSVILTSDTSLAAGTYTVTVGSMTSDPFVVTKQTPTSLKIANTTIANQKSARVYFQVLDQYNEVMENYSDTKLVVNAYNVTKGHAISRGTNSKKDYFVLDCSTETVTNNGAYLNAIGDKISVVAYLKDNASVACTTELEIVRVYTDELTFGDVKLGNDKRVTVNRTYELTYTAKDTEGKDVTFDEQAAGSNKATAATVSIGNFNFISSNISAVRMDKVFVDSNGRLNFEAEGTAGTAVITAINTITGKTTNTTIVVANTAKLSSVDIADASVACDASDNLKFKAAVTAYDQFGEVIDPKNVKNVQINAANTTTACGDFTSITVTPANTIRLNKFTSDGKYVEYQVIDPSKLVKGQSVRLDFVSKEMGETGYIRSTATVNVDDEIEASALEIVKAPDATVGETGTVSVQFAMKDQYQNKMSLVTNSAIVGNIATGAAWIKQYGSTISDSYVVDYECSNGIVVVTSCAFKTTNDTDVYKMEFKARSVKDELSESGTLTLKLKDGNKVIASKSFDISVVDSVTSYKVSTDKNKYAAGETIKVTVDAYSTNSGEDRFNNYYNATIDAKVVESNGVKTNNYSKTLKFENGTATFDIVAGTADENNKYNITVTDKNKRFDGATDRFGNLIYAFGSMASDDYYEVTVGAAGKLKVVKDAGANQGKLRIYDSKDNETKTTGHNTYAKFKVMDENLNKDITWDVDLGLGTLRADATLPISINGDNIVTCINTENPVVGNAYNLATGLTVINIPDTSKDHNLILSITIEGLTWEKKIHYTNGTGTDTFADSSAAGAVASAAAKNKTAAAVNSIKAATQTSVTTGAIVVSFGSVITGCDSIVSKTAVASRGAIPTPSTSAAIVNSVAMTNSKITTTLGGTPAAGDTMKIILPVDITASATTVDVAKVHVAKINVEITYTYATATGWSAAVVVKDPVTGDIL